MSGRFDPSRYAQVKDRIPLFWENYPAGRITTEIYALSEDWTRVIIKACVYRDVDEAEPTATGFAEETQTPNGGGANRNSHIENCETSAIGRALANFKFQGGIERPSREEMEKAQRVGTANAGFEEGQRVADAPRNTPAPRPAPRQEPQDVRSAVAVEQAGERATERQIKFCVAIGRESGMTEPELNDWCQELYGTDLDHLNRRDASTLIEALQRRRHEVA